MVKIAHISDVHFRPIKRHQEYKKAFKCLFKQLKNETPDIIINTGDFYHLKTAQITPEVIEIMSWAFTELSTIAPVYSILGNHDYVISNKNRKNIISTIHKIVNRNNIILLEKSKTVDLIINNQKIAIHPFSLFDKENWNKLIPNDEAINIALFHGSVMGCITDTNWKIRGCEENVEFFKKFDFVLLGDIHKQQWIAERTDCFGNKKPWIAYPGSLIQQNFGEDETKGYLVWDIHNKTEWNVNFKKLENYYPFITIPWKGNVSTTISDLILERNNKEILPGTRFRISSSQEISLLETRKIIHELKENYKASDIIFKCNSISKMDHFMSNNLKISKKGLRQDPDAVTGLYENYISDHAKNYDLCPNKINEAKNIIKDYMLKLTNNEVQDITSNLNWSIKSFEFDNLFRYGENNKIDFEKLNGIVGIFGSNKIGKALDINTVIPTINGWKKIIDINNNDLIFDRNGNPCKVIAKSDIFYNHKCYKIIFSDNVEIIADAEHQWFVNDHQNVLPIEKILTTEQLFDGNVNILYSKNKHRWSVTNTKPVCYNGSENNENCFSFGKNELFQRHNSIPKEYLFTSLKNRVSLFQGIINNNNNSSLDEFGNITIEHTSKNAANSLSELMSSLGFVSNISLSKDEKNYILSCKITNDTIKFLSEKDRNFLQTSKKWINDTKFNKRFIIAIEKHKPIPVQCLVVDSPDHSFLFGKQYIPTHNSSIIGALMYTLFNTTDRGSIKNSFIINNNKSHGKGKIRIVIENEDYVIERQSKKSLNKKNQNDNKSNTILNFYKVELDKNGQEKLKSLNSISKDETDKLIRKKIGTANDFLLTALSSQGNVDNFIKEGPTERKNILSKFLDLDIFKQLSEIVRKDINTLNVKSNMFSVENISNKIEKIKKEIFLLENEIKKIENEDDKQHKEKENIKLWLLHHEKNAAEIDIKKIDDLEKNIIFNKDDLQKKEKNILSLENDIKQINKKLSEIRLFKLNIDVELLKNKINEFETIKCKLHELKHEISSQEDKLQTQKKNVRKLDLVPCGDKFPNCHYIKDGHEDKKLIKKQEELLQFLNEKFISQQDLFNNFLKQKLKENIQKWEELDKEEYTLAVKIETKQNNLLYEKKEIENCKNTITVQINELTNYKKKVNILEGKEYHTKQEKIKDIEGKIIKLSKYKQEKLLLFGALKEKLQNLNNDQKESIILIDKLKIYNSIQDAFSKTGIPSMVLLSQLPAINLELNKILSSVVDFKITMETDINTNIMDVYIEDEHSKRIIELASGMEKTIASMALRVALINLSSLPKSDIFIIDEGYGALDGENKQAAILFLQNLKNYFKTILTISHVPEIKDSTDMLIDVENDGLDSKVYF